jgi:hypothetical protein
MLAKTIHFLNKINKKRLKEIENEFEDVKKELEG